MAELLEGVDQLASPSEDEQRQTIYLILVDDDEERDQQPGGMVEGSIERRPGEAATKAGASLLNSSPTWVRVLAFLGVVAFFGPVLLVPVSSPVFALPVTIVIEPATTQVELETTLTLKARQLEAPTLSASKTVQTTGEGYQPASFASGFITLYNVLPSPQFVPAGTIITGASGVEVMLDESVSIPGGNGATNGKATVTAHTLLTGPDANIPALDTNSPCCLNYILAKNTAFSGGQEERHYPVVAKKDIEQSAKELETSLHRSGEAIFFPQIRDGEVISSPDCHLTITANHQEGEEASEVHITVTLSCIASAYRKEQLQQALLHKLDQQATSELGSSFKRTGDIQLDVLQSQPQESTVVLQIKATGSYAYQFSVAQLEYLKKGIAGKGRAEATHWLQQQRGIALVTLQEERLPINGEAIQIVLGITPERRTEL